MEIYIAGCSGSPHCSGCHNPESWDFNQGTTYDIMYFFNNIKEKIRNFNILIDNVMIFGGEPLDQNPQELKYLLTDLRTLGKQVWLFTRYDFEDLPDFVLDYCNYIKCGRYISELTSDNNVQYSIKLATSNQKIYKKGVDYR